MGSEQHYLCAKGTAMATPPTPEGIMQLGFGYWGSKTLLSAVELGLFTALATGPQDAEALTQRLGLHPRGTRDFFDALVALGMVQRDGTHYKNTPETDLYPDGTGIFIFCV